MTDLKRTIRRIRWSIRRSWDRLRAPWPIVDECHGHLLSLNASVAEMLNPPKCPQCRGGHVHDWRAWPKAPGWVTAGAGVPIRCRICGTRKCDRIGCQQRRHHHTHAEESR